MIAVRLELATFVALATVAGAAAANDPRWIHLRGPGDPDCAGEIERARSRGDAALYLAQIKCRVHTGWKCPATCKGDELLVAHVAVKLQRNGRPDDGKVIRGSDSRDFDDMSLKAVKNGAPYPAPPPPLLDGAGAAPLNIEFACDCAERPKTPKQ
jgi:TonB family protein